MAFDESTSIKESLAKTGRSSMSFSRAKKSSPGMVSRRSMSKIGRSVGSKSSLSSRSISGGMSSKGMY